MRQIKPMGRPDLSKAITLTEVSASTWIHLPYDTGLENGDGNSVVYYDRTDGLYARCITPTGGVFHITLGTIVIPADDQPPAPLTKE